MKYGFSKSSGQYTGVYSDDFENEDLGFVSFAVPDNLISPKIDNPENPTSWINGISGIELENALILKEKTYIKGKYESHRKNGWAEYQDFRAGVVYDISKNLISEEQAFQLEAYLKDAYDKINNTGDWKTAKYVLQNLSDHPEWMQVYIDKAIERVSNYILNNYDPS